MNNRSIPDHLGPALQELKKRLLQTYGERLKGVGLYGSYARGKATQDSDIDILVRLEGDVQTGREIARMSPAVSEISLLRDLLISVFPVSEERFHSYQSPFLQVLRREAVPV